MRIIDADALVKQLKEDAENLQGLAFQMATSHLIGTVENQLTIMGMVAVDSAELEEKDARVAELEKRNSELEKKLEANKLHIQQLQDASEYNNGLINGLQFAVRCNGISPDVTLPFR